MQTEADPPVRVYDHEGFLGRLLADEDMAVELVDLYLDDVPALIDGLAGALRSGDREHARLLSHRLRGSSATVGGLELQGLAAAVESATAAGDVAEASRVAREIDGAFDRLRDALRRRWRRADSVYGGSR